MKSVLSNKCCEKKELPYPKLMGSINGNVYLMETKTTGVRLYTEIEGVNTGIHCDFVNKDVLTDYEGDVCLTNETAV